jgi:hypothetical protein
MKQSANCPNYRKLEVETIYSCMQAKMSRQVIACFRNYFVECLHVRFMLEPVSRNPKIMRPIYRPIINALFPYITDHMCCSWICHSARLKLKDGSVYTGLVALTQISRCRLYIYGLYVYKSIVNCIVYAVSHFAINNPTCRLL